jgi:pilus assembly protein CpaF
MVLMANMGLTEPVIRQQAASAIQLVVHMARLRDGTRKLSSMAEVVGASHDGVALKEIFRFERSGMDESKKVVGRFVPTGYRPQFLKRLQASGVEISPETFEGKQ